MSFEANNAVEFYEQTYDPAVETHLIKTCRFVPEGTTRTTLARALKAPVHAVHMREHPTPL